MYFKKNHFCESCNFLYKTIWNSKKTIDEKDRALLGYNCFRYWKSLNGLKLKSQLQNIKSFRCSRSGLSKIELPLYEINIG